MVFFKKKRIKKEPVWHKCRNCGEVIYHNDLIDNLSICPVCGNYFRMEATDRINMLIDAGSFKEQNKSLKSLDPLGFSDLIPYKERLEKTIAKCKMNESVVTGTAKMEGMGIALAVFDFRFMGGSMGYVTGEKLVRLIEYAARKKRPLIIVSASGGARMQEGALSLLQMARTAAAIAMFAKTGMPYISVLTDPTTGGVAASFAMLGDIAIAEPKALIGFAGPRVIEDTIGHKLPDGFQRSEFLLEHGFLDKIVERKSLKEEIVKILKILIHVE